MNNKREFQGLCIVRHCLAAAACISISFAASAQWNGSWKLLQGNAEIVAIHAALLHTGEIIYFSGYKEGNKEGPARLWRPPLVGDTVGNSKSKDVSNLDQDIFGSGHCFLADGRLLVVGGTGAYNDGKKSHTTKGASWAVAFHPSRNSWQRQEDMKGPPRWYPTCTALPGGEILVLSGWEEDNNCVEESLIFDTRVSPHWRLLDSKISLPLYPRVHLLPSGKLFFTGVGTGKCASDKNSSPMLLELKTQVWTPIESFPTEQRSYGTSVLLPLREGKAAKVLLLGGHGSQQHSARTIEFGLNELVNRSKPIPMKRRAHHNAVLLPDGKVLVVGGVTDGEFCGDVLESEIFDPSTNKFHHAGPMSVGRGYHSTALLIPDGRVVAMGTGKLRADCDENNKREPERRIEIYTPAYMNGKRPSVTLLSGEVAGPAEPYPDMTRSEEYSVYVKDPGAISHVSMVRPGAVTHGFDMEQRLVEVEISKRTSNTVVFNPPRNPAMAPPGYYMIFLIDRKGIPSIGVFSRLVN